MRDRDAGSGGPQGSFVGLTPICRRYFPILRQLAVVTGVVVVVWLPAAPMFVAGAVPYVEACLAAFEHGPFLARLVLMVALTRRARCRQELIRPVDGVSARTRDDHNLCRVDLLGKLYRGGG